MINNDEKILKKGGGVPHCVMIDQREKMTVSGVEDVDSFDESVIAMSTSQGRMSISGEGLHIEQLNVDTGDLTLTGHINGVEYIDGKPKKDGFLSRLFG